MGTIEFLGSHWPWSWQICNCEYNIFTANSFLMLQNEYPCIGFIGGASFKFAFFRSIQSNVKFIVYFCAQSSWFTRNNCQMTSVQFFCQKRWNLNFIIDKVWAFKFVLMWMFFIFLWGKKNFPILNLYRSLENGSKGYESVYPSNIKSKWISLQEQKVKVFDGISF